MLELDHTKISSVSWTTALPKSLAFRNILCNPHFARVAWPWESEQELSAKQFDLRGVQQKPEVISCALLLLRRIAAQHVLTEEQMCGAASQLTPPSACRSPPALCTRSMET